MFKSVPAGFFDDECAEFGSLGSVVQVKEKMTTHPRGPQSGILRLVLARSCKARTSVGALSRVKSFVLRGEEVGVWVRRGALNDPAPTIQGTHRFLALERGSYQRHL